MSGAFRRIRRAQFVFHGAASVLGVCWAGHAWFRHFDGYKSISPAEASPKQIYEGRLLLQRAASMRDEARNQSPLITYSSGFVQGLAGPYVGLYAGARYLKQKALGQEEEIKSNTLKALKEVGLASTAIEMAHLIQKKGPDVLLEQIQRRAAEAPQKMVKKAMEDVPKVPYHLINGDFEKIKQLWNAVKHRMEQAESIRQQAINLKEDSGVYYTAWTELYKQKILVESFGMTAGSFVAAWGLKKAIVRRDEFITRNLAGQYYEFGKIPFKTTVSKQFVQQLARIAPLRQMKFLILLSAGCKVFFTTQEAFDKFFYDVEKAYPEHSKLIWNNFREMIVDQSP
jgi:hypothetical protein